MLNKRNYKNLVENLEIYISNLYKKIKVLDEQSSSPDADNYPSYTDIKMHRAVTNAPYSVMPFEDSPDTRSTDDRGPDKYDPECLYGGVYPNCNRPPCWITNTCNPPPPPPPPEPPPTGFPS